MFASKPKYMQLIAIAKNKVGVCDDDHRAILKRFGAKVKDGRISATTLTIWQLAKVLDHYKKTGFQVVQKPAQQSTLQHPQVQKIIALWNDLFKQKKINNHSIKSLNGWIKRQTGLKTIDKLTQDKKALHQTIESLKKWKTRSI